MRRREFITLLGGAAAAWPIGARAQQSGPMKRIGFVIGNDGDAEGRARLAALRQGLAALGWIEGRNIEIVVRFGATDPNRNRAYVAEFLALAPDVIVSSDTPTVAALVKENRTIPIVMPMAGDPVADGLAESLARPGGNVTGFAHFEAVTAGKWLELLRDVAPGVTRAAILVSPREPDAPAYVRAAEAAAPLLGIQLTTAYVRDDAEIEQTIDAFARLPNGGLIVPPSAAIAIRRTLILLLAARHRLPAVYAFPYIAREGGLMSYGPDVLDMYRRSASYVDRILKSAKPADLPIQYPTKFELVVNLKAAKAIGLTIPESFLLRADEVIE